MTEFDRIVDRRGTGCVKYDVLTVDGYPADTIPLWIADMDFPVPDCAVQALHRMADHAVFGYNFPTRDYLSAVQGWFARRHGWTPETEWIVTTPGVVYALSAAVRAFTQPGDKVLVLPPVYGHFFPPVVENGRELISCPLAAREGRYEIDFAALEETVAREAPRMLIFCSPHNPVGRVWTEEELRELGRICFAHGVLVVADEIHCDFVYPGHRHVPFLSLGEEFRQNAISCTAPSKTFNLAGLEDSNIFIPDPGLRRKFRSEMSAQGVNGCATAGRVACQAVYEGGDRWLDELLVYLKGNFDAVAAFLAEHLPQLTLSPLEGTYLAWLDARALGMDPKALEAFLRDKAHLRFSQGPEFATGHEGDGFLRMNLAAPRAVLTEAMERLRKALEQG